jgi:hypothetical protein
MRARTRTPTPDRAPAPTRDHALAPPTLRLLGAALCLGVTAVHIVDQGGLPGTKTPDYVQGLYYTLELGGVLTAAALLASRVPSRWLLAVAMAGGPIVGYVLSRGPGLPNYSDEIGNWGEPLGVVSLVVESALLLTAATALGLARRRGQRYRQVTQS